MPCLDQAVLAEAQKDLGSTSDYGLPGVFCSVAAQTWIRRAAASQGVPMPIPGSPGALNTKTQFQQRNAWLSIEQVRADPSLIRPGMVPVWHRGEAASCSGHIGIAASGYDPATGTFLSLEANAGPTVAVYRRRLDTPTLLGFGFFPCPTETSPLSIIQAPTTTFEQWILPIGLAAAAAVVAWQYRKRIARRRIYG